LKTLSHGEPAPGSSHGRVACHPYQRFESESHLAKYNVILSAPYMQPVVERFGPVLERAGCALIIPNVHERLSEEELLPIIGNADGIICGDDRLTRKVLQSARRLRVISKWGTGIDSIDQVAARELGIKVCNTPNAFSQPVADSVFAAMLHFARRTAEMDREMKAGAWDKIPGKSLSECTLGVIGLGNVGKAVVQRAAGFGMTILGSDPVAPPADFLDRNTLRLISFGDLLSASDFVSINCDLNPTTHHLMNAGAFAQMKASAILINTARGPIVDEVALVDALRAQQLAGAALDVFEVEPLPATSALRSMSNTLLSPHNSNSSPAAWERVHQNTIRNLLENLQGVQQWKLAS